MKTLIISANDLEAAEILEVARKSGEFRCIELKKAAGYSSNADGEPLPWGGRLDPADPHLAIDALEPVVFLVEAPAPGFEEVLRQSGRVVEIIDHHLYIDHCNRIIDRRCSRSSLEQFVTLLGTGELSSRQRLIAANDRGSWPAMIAAAKAGAVGAEEAPGDGAVLDEIWKIRAADLACRIDSARIDELLDEALAFLDGAETQGRLRVLGCGRGKAEHPELVLIKAPDRFKAVLVDAVYRAHYRSAGKGAQAGEQTAPDGRRWRNDASLNERPLEILAVYEDDRRQVTQVEYSGPAARQRIVDQLVGAMAPETRLTLWAGCGDLGCYVGAEAGAATSVELGGFASRLLDAVLGGNRPLARWRTQFLQLLRYDPETIKPQITVETASSFRDAAVGEPVRNYFLDYMRPFFAPRPETDGKTDASPAAGAADQGCMRSVSWPEEAVGPWVRAIDPWSLTIHSYRWGDDAPLPRFRIEWLDEKKNPLWSDERPLSHLCVHFLFGGLIVLEWGFQDGWLGYDAVKNAAPASLVDQLLRLPILMRDGHRRKCERSGAKAEQTVFRSLGSDKSDFPTIAFETEHTPGIDCVAELLDFNEAARQCYSSFFSPSQKTLALLLPPPSKQGEWTAPTNSELVFGEKTQADARRPDKWFAALVKMALEPFGLSVCALSLVFDERARVVTAAACVGERPVLPAAVAVQERLFARLTTVEAFHPGHFYDRKFAQAEIGKARYDRFRSQEEFPESSQLFAATDHSLAFLGHGWFAIHVTMNHVACHYQRLFLIALLYRSVFHGFSHRLGELSRRRRGLDERSARLQRAIDEAAERGRLASTDRRKLVVVRKRLDEIADKVREIKARFVAFDSGLWFEDICTQIQGEELFRLMTRQLRVDAHHREIGDKIAGSDALEAEEGRRRDESRVQELTILGTFAATLVAIGTVLPLFTGGPSWLAILFAAILAALMPAVVLAMTRDLRPMPALITTVALAKDFACKLIGAACSAAKCALCGLCRSRCKDR